MVCSDACEHSLLDTGQSFEGKLKSFIIGLVIGMVLVMTGAVLAPVKESLLSLMGGGLVVLGVTFFLCPFVTPQTVGLIGLKRGCPRRPGHPGR